MAYLFYFWLHWVFIAALSFLYLQQLGATLVAVQGLLIAVASLVASSRALERTGFRRGGAWA